MIIRWAWTGFTLWGLVALGGCMTVGAPMVCTAASVDPRFDITQKDCIQGFKDQAEWQAKPIQPFTGTCPGTSYWNGVGCTTAKP